MSAPKIFGRAVRRGEERWEGGPAGARRGMKEGLKEWSAITVTDCGARRTLMKTQDYLEVFARFKQKANIEAVERILANHPELELFERSQLGT